jgi:hypothetical protein
VVDPFRGRVFAHDTTAASGVSRIFVTLAATVRRHPGN